MSKLPQLNLRIPSSYHGLIRQIAERLRDRDGADFAHELDAFLIGMPQSTRAVALGDLEARVKVLEALVLDVPEPPRPPEPPRLPEPPRPPEPPRLPEPPRPPDRIPDDLLARAAKLRDRGNTWQIVAGMMARELGREIGENAARNAVDRWRKRTSPK
jgi:hypothetical protein